MQSEPMYLAARVVAPQVEAHFAVQVQNARQAGFENLASIPNLSIIENIIDAAFWASLLREEGHPPKISIAILKPSQAGNPLVLANKLRLTPHNLTKLAPAVEQPGIHLGAWCDEEGIYIWGTTHRIPGLCFVLEVVEPGLLVIKHKHLDGFGKFVNVAVLQGDQIKMVDEQNTALSDCPDVLSSLMAMPLPGMNGESLNILIEIAASMRSHNRGGLVLIVPNDDEEWRSSIINPISYPVTPRFTGISELMQQDKQNRSKLEWQQAMRNAIDIIGGFTAVDGATIINRSHELLAFGAKIARAELSIPVTQMLVTEPTTDGTASYIHPAQNGGTRHLAAAQFVHDQHGAMAMVASQDGHFTIFAWSENLQTVHAHRIDILLL
ncbi:hypothetical protein C8P68_107174 [Mucilaginibacter yixingensis]|uniref:Probable sensor domain-containing protein n=1 Tax=Mucilaginibacter yixingensis TaxID=1295612 RepID=A0A2T5J6H3_9SPHI|nr:hypothetical protein [Mucilaginibacter yixingensis]PTQ94109.1 hypothetical protein C8P68_107174 [Mucilaginibacter yixingensis]